MSERTIIEKRPHLPQMARLALLLAILPTSTSSAAPRHASRDLGSWAVSASSDGQGCFLSRTYPGPGATTLMLGLDVDNRNRLTILNANWSIRAKDSVRLTFRLSNAAFPRHLAVGLAADGKQGFVTSFGAAFPASFAASAFLHIARGDVPVEALSLAGSGAAVAELRRCVELHRGAPAAAESKGRDAGRIPIDPFAVQTQRTPRK